MNMKRFVIACGAVFIFIFVYEWLFHGVLLRELYAQMPTLWRAEAEMHGYFHWLVIGQLWLAVLFCLIFVKGYENKGLAEGVRYGLLIGLLFIGPDMIFYAVQPLPAKLIVDWSIGGLLEMIIGGVIVAAIYRPVA
ncbi:MAG: hypothetical protein L0Y67_05145 [Gammaproteobacteria bacterium]|nr:hypothetical protein [Gammaproteobacteria bacterium]MCI0590976.1 hypothetical protein [Gammaproteobacteria bacterium]